MGTETSGEEQRQQEGCTRTKHPSPTIQLLPNLPLMLSIGQTPGQAEGKGAVGMSPTGEPAEAQSSEKRGRVNLEESAGVQNKDTKFKSPEAF